MKENFLRLVRLGIGNSAEPLCEPIDWDEVEVFAVRQGLLGVVLDGIQRLRINENLNENLNLPDKVFMLEWLGKVMLEEQRYVEYRKAIAALVAFYNAHGFRMMLLKGYACGKDWPMPEHRPYGDIDIWLFGKQKEADAALENLNNNNNDNVNGHKGKVFSEVKIDRSHHHHTVFNWMGFTVENHYDFINVHHHRSNAELEKIFKELGSEANLNENDNRNAVGTRIQSVDVNGQKVFLPSPNLHALFLLKHLVSHFASERMTLRQLLDWAFFVEKHTKEIDWGWLLPIVEDFHMKEFFDIVNAICVEDLGFYPVESLEFSVESLLKSLEFRNLKERVLDDILEPEFSEKAPKNVLRRIPFKYCRWKANEWKHFLCYKESMHSAFWSGVKNHLLKPSSI